MKVTMASTCATRALINRRGLTSVLKSAACEWLVIAGMLVNAMVTYLLAKFASYSNLQTPCIFCSRIDHVLGNKRPEFYRSLLCARHRSEVSSMVACSTHDRIADGSGMCEECLFSSLLVNEPNSNMYRSLLRKVGNISGSFALENSFSKAGYMAASVGTRLCSCCKKPWILRKDGHKTRRLKPSRPNVPLPLLSPGKGYGRDENATDIQQHSRWTGKTRRHTLTHIGYSGLRISSDSETELPLSDHDDDLLNGNTSEGYLTEDELNVHNKTSSDLSFTKPSALSDRITNAKEFKKPNAAIPGRRVDIGVLIHDSNESIEAQEPLLPQLISFDNHVHTNSYDPGADSIKEGEDPFRISDSSDKSVISELKALADSYFVNVIDGHAIVSRKQDGNGLEDKTDDTLIKGMRLKVGSSMVAPDEMMKLASNQGSIETIRVHQSETDIVGVTQPCKNVDQVGMFLSDNEIKHESLPSERKISETLEEGFIGEVKAENSVEELQRQLDEERKRNSSLYAELEEERNASAVAANQAMAMITRLQEEKASLHMEALQYLRMMEEQAEYNVDALEKANDLLAEREKEILEMEADLEIFQSKFTGSIPESIEDTPLRPNENNRSEEGTTALSMSSFQDEKIFITHTLKEIEEKLEYLNCHLPSNGNHLNEIKAGGQETVHQENGESLPIQIPTLSTEEDSIACGDNSINLAKEGSYAMDKEPASTHSVDILLALENEVCDLNDRIEAFESDWIFIKHTLKSLEYGKEGLRFIQEIASHLAELRKLQFRRRSQSREEVSGHSQVLNGSAE